MKQMFSSVKKGIFFLFMWSFSLCLLAQNITVRGTVTDTSGEPLIGVTVQVKGTSVGTVTDIDGTFILSNVPSNATLEISYVGMASQSVAVNGRTTLNIVLQEDAETLDEVVVVGYGVQKKETLTGAIAQVRGEELENRITSNMTSALQGVLANVNVSI
ncbi:MAG TPA: SusC/RagA family TonB-linked outer membrane protein, partial [Porphyromonadaceae bacterium]|nr:SusC/RagA family TonB-linked outer membrane protein [Porphyromonadaceae bacterium]